MPSAYAGDPPREAPGGGQLETLRAQRSTSTLDSVYMHALSGLDRWKSCIKGVSQFPSETTKFVCVCVKNTLMVAASTVFTVVVVVVRD